MSAKQLIEGLEGGLQAVTNLATSFSQESPAAARIAGIAGELSLVANLALNTIGGLAEKDISKLQVLASDLQAKNDELAALVAAS